MMYNGLELSLLQRCGYSMEPSPNTSIEATFTPDGQYVVSGICLLHYLLLTDICIYIYICILIVIFFHLRKALEMEICMPGASTGGMRYQFL